MEKTKTVLWIGIVFLFVFCAGCSRDSSDAGVVKKTVEGYLEALASHDTEEMKHFLSADLQVDVSDEEYYTEFVETVVSCESVEVDTEHMEKLNDTAVEVPVSYVLTYSEDYIPVGTREVGENAIEQIFALDKNKAGDYLITEIRNAVQE